MCNRLYEQLEAYFPNIALPNIGGETSCEFENKYFILHIQILDNVIIIGYTESLVAGVNKQVIKILIDFCTESERELIATDVEVDAIWFWEKAGFVTIPNTNNWECLACTLEKEAA